MDLNLSVPMEEEILCPKITVIGVGGAGGNAVNNMISSNLEGVEFVVANTDAQAMQQSLCDRRIQLGRNITAGLGAGSRPDVGGAAAEESLDEIMRHLEGANMVFITAGMGGGTGTGAAPVVARAAREAGILTVGVVTKPFQFEGIHRMRLAEQGIQELTKYVDTLIIIPNQNLFRLATEKTTFADAFKMADDVLYSGVRGVTDLMVMPGLINLDFADIRSVMTEMGKAMMGTGESEGPDRAIAAAEAAISNPLLAYVSMHGARGVLINSTGGMDMTLFEVDEAANRIREEVDPDANIIFGSTFDEALNGRMRVSVVATGIDMEAKAARPRPVTLSVVGSDNQAQAAAGGATAQQPRTLSQPVGISQVLAATAMRPAAQATALAQQEAEPLAEAEEETLGSAEVEEAQEPEQANKDEAFIPPEPMQVASRPSLNSGPPPAARREPEAAPAQSSAFGGFSCRKASSLITRVTGVGRQASAPQAEKSTAREVAPGQRAEPSLSAKPQGPVRPQPAPRLHSQTEAQPQPKLGVDPKDRLQTSKEEEELLDIPAFLRRQAN